jgi:hypothetical protein
MIRNSASILCILLPQSFGRQKSLQKLSRWCFRELLETNDPRLGLLYELTCESTMRAIDADASSFASRPAGNSVA